MNYLIFTLGVIMIVLFILGLAYAILIYHRPFPPGWTWASVVIGVAFTGTGEIVAIIATLAALNLQPYWWLATYPLVAYVITGIPMIWLQIKKQQDQNRKNNNLDKEFVDESTTLAR